MTNPEDIGEDILKAAFALVLAASVLINLVAGILTWK